MFVARLATQKLKINNSFKKTSGKCNENHFHRMFLYSLHFLLFLLSVQKILWKIFKVKFSLYLISRVFFLGGQRTILNYFLAHCGACMYVVLYIFTYPVQFPLIDPSAANSTASSPWAHLQVFSYKRFSFLKPLLVLLFAWLLLLLQRGARNKSGVGSSKR